MVTVVLPINPIIEGPGSDTLVAARGAREDLDQMSLPGKATRRLRCV